MEPSDAKRLRELIENAKLKRIVADQVLDMSAMKELCFIQSSRALAHTRTLTSALSRLRCAVIVAT